MLATVRRVPLSSLVIDNAIRCFRVLNLGLPYDTYGSYMNALHIATGTTVRKAMARTGRVHPT